MVNVKVAREVAISLMIINLFKSYFVPSISTDRVPATFISEFMIVGNSISATFETYLTHLPLNIILFQLGMNWFSNVLFYADVLAEFENPAVLFCQSIRNELER